MTTNKKITSGTKRNITTTAVALVFFTCAVNLTSN